MQAPTRPVLYILLALLTLPAAGALAQSEREQMEALMTAPPRETRVPEGVVATPMELSFGKPAIEVMINGRGPFKLLVDTGASPTLILNSDLAAELGLESIGTSAVGDPTDPEAIEVQVMHVDSVGLGAAWFGEMDAIAWDRSTLYSGEDAPRGIVGFPMFRDVLVTFDYPAGEMRVERGALRPGAHVVEYTAPNGIPNIPFSIGGESHVAMLDSGSMGALMLPRELGERLELTSPMTEIGRARTVNSEFAIYAADYAGSISIAGHDIVAESLTFFDLLPTPNIGSQVLGQFAVTFDQEHQLARFERSAGAAVPIRKPKSGLGLRLANRGGGYEVAGTLPDTPAAAADLRAGDVLISVNGLGVSDLPPGDFAVEMRKPTVVLMIERDGERREVVLERDE